MTTSSRVRRRARRRLARTALAAALVFGAAWPLAAQATFPGRNGAIAFVRDGDIWAINVDGSGLRQITTNPAPDRSPAWSPDGSEILFTRHTHGTWDVYRFRVDGSVPPVRLTTTDEHEYGPAWSPDGTRIAYTRQVPEAGMFHNLLVADRDGRGERAVSVGTNPDWSPDGSLIATDIDGDEWSTIGLAPPSGAPRWTFPGTDAGRLGDMEFGPSWMPSGAGIVHVRHHYADERYESALDDPVSELRITTLDGRSRVIAARRPFFPWHDPEWSPDGRQIAYATASPGVPGVQIRVLDADGGGDRAVTREGADSSEPTWQPLEAASPAPLVTTISPAVVDRGAPALTLVVNGSGFVARSVVRVSGEDRPTTLVNAGRLLAEIHASDLAPAGELEVRVVTAPPGGGVSETRSLLVRGPSAAAPPRVLARPASQARPVPARR